jgi:hypothetical protein
MSLQDIYFVAATINSAATLAIALVKVHRERGRHSNPHRKTARART